MIPVYICDDNETEKRYLNEIVENLILIQGYDMKVVLASNTPEEVLAHRQTHKNRSIYILDVILEHEKHNGFTLAKQIRELDARGFIVFVTTHEEMMYETFRYRLEAMDYLIKEEPKRLSVRLKECLAEIDRLAGSEKDDSGGYFAVKVDGSIFHIPKKDILCLRTTGEVHRVTLYAKDRVLEFRGDLSSLEKDIGSGYMRIHRSCLVRADKIRQVNFSNGTLVMGDGLVCPISRKGKQLLKDFLS